MTIILLDFKEEMYPETLCGAIMRISDDILIVVQRISSLPSPLSAERLTPLNSHSTGYINGVSVKKWVDCLGISLKQIWVLALCLLICLPLAQTFEISSPVIAEYEILNTWICKAENMSRENCPSQSDERAVINNCGFKCKEGTHPKCVRVETGTRYICSETSLSCPPGKRRRAMLDKNDLKKVKVVEEDCPNDYYQPTHSGCYDDACQFKQGDIDNISESFLILPGNKISYHKLYCDYINGYYNAYGKTFIPASDLMYERDFCTHISERNPCTGTNISLLPNGTCVVPCASDFVRDAKRSFICVSENDLDMEESPNNMNVNHESALAHNVDKDHHDKEHNTNSTRSVAISDPVDSKDKGKESDSHPTLIETVLICVLGSCLVIVIIFVAKYICWKKYRQDGNDDSPGKSTNDVESRESNSESEPKDETIDSLQEPLLEQMPKSNELLKSKDDNSDINHRDIPLTAMKNTTETTDSQGNAGKFKNPQDDTLDQLIASALPTLMQSVGVLIYNGNPQGTVFRVGPVYAMTAFHVVERIITDPKGNVIDPRRLEKDPDHFISFEASICTPKTKYRAKLKFWNKSADVVVLEITNSDTNLPRPLFLWQHKFSNLQQTHLLAIGFGHPNKTCIKHFEKCKIIGVDTNRHKVMMENQAKHGDKYRNVLGVADAHLVDEGYKDFYNRNLINLDLFMGKGLSGGPVITLEPKSQKVVGIVSGGKPEFYYKLPSKVQNEFPHDCCYEVALAIETLYEIISSKDKELAEQIFVDNSNCLHTGRAQ